MVLCDAALGVLMNLCAYVENAETFMNDGGIDYLDTLLQNEDIPLKTKLQTIGILHNIAASPRLVCCFFVFFSLFFFCLFLCFFV